MTTEAIPAPAADKPETVTIPHPAAEVKPQSAETSVSPPASTTEPAGNEQQTPDPLKKAEPEQPTEAELKRKARNQERWRRMKQEASEVQALRAELELLRPRQIDPATITDPEELIAEKTADKLTERQRAVQQARLEQAQKAQQESVLSAWDDIKQDMRERVPDFDTVVNDRTPIHKNAAPFIVESEKGGEIAYWLGKNPDAARDLFNKFETSPAQALIELGRIEARVSAPPPKVATQAPKPAPVLSGGANPLAFDAKSAGVGDVQAQLRKAGVIR